MVEREGGEWGESLMRKFQLSRLLTHSTHLRRDWRHFSIKNSLYRSIWFNRGKKVAYVRSFARAELKSSWIFHSSVCHVLIRRISQFHSGVHDNCPERDEEICSTQKESREKSIQSVFACLWCVYCMQSWNRLPTWDWVISSRFWNSINFCFAVDLR